MSPALAAVVAVVERLAEMDDRDPRFGPLYLSMLGMIEDLNTTEQVALYHLMAEDGEQRPTYLGPVGEA